MEKKHPAVKYNLYSQTERQQAPSFSFYKVISHPQPAILSQPVFACSKSTIETPEKCVKSAQSYQ